jgi:LPS-assembly lipoprotein
MSRLALVLLLALAGCGLRPVYSGGSNGAAATMLAGIDVPPIPDRSGYMVRQALLDRLGAGGANSPYRLDIELDDKITGLGVRGDDSISRERRTLRARWQLVDTASGNVLIDAAVRSDAGVDVVRSEYAVVAAETAALERLAEDIAGQIANRISIYAQSRAEQ